MSLLTGQERATMPTAQPETPATAAIRTLEVRWIFPGELETPVVRWFGRLPAETETESREDAYLLSHLPGLSVKIRGGRALEVKVYQGSPGMLDMAGRARGRLESWEKWSFPFGQPSPGGGQAPCWRPVRKRRRIGWFSLASEPALTHAAGSSGKPGCAVELTEVITRGEAWWTLGLEATGPADLVRSGLAATAALVFAHALPSEVKLGMNNSWSYAEWLWRQPG